MLTNSFNFGKVSAFMVVLFSDFIRRNYFSYSVFNTILYFITFHPSLRRLNNLHGEYDLETSPYASEAKSDELVADTSGLVAGISVLGVLLFATLSWVFNLSTI